MTDLSRRGFLRGIIAAGVAPLIVRSGLIMPIKSGLVVPSPGYGFGPVLNDWGAIGVREDLADVIYQISPQDIPLFNIARARAAAVLREWATDGLAVIQAV